MPAAKIKEYMQQGYKIVYEYIDDLNPHLAGTDELPVNVKEKYDLAMTDKNIFVVVTALKILYGHVRSTPIHISCIRPYPLSRSVY